MSSSDAPKQGDWPRNPVSPETNAPPAGGITQTHTGAQSKPTPSSMDVYTASFVALLIAVIVAAIFYYLSLRAFKRRYTALSDRVNDQFQHLDDAADGVASPGHSYALASRGPTVSRDAEMQSAEARWRHLAVAFPHLGHDRFDDSDRKRDLFLVSTTYTGVKQVEVMQELVRERFRAHFQNGRNVVEPEWVAELGENFDALRHPQLAIANPAVYTFPFFLTWQRRHQWGVLPYATHTRLGVIVREDHPKLAELRSIEVRYQQVLEEAAKTGLLLWTNDPRYAIWLTLLLDAVGTAPFTVTRTIDGAVNWEDQHSPTVFSVGAYLHKELLPLTCAAMAAPRPSAAYASYAQEIEISDLPGLLAAAATGAWARESAVVVDLAVLQNDELPQGWTLLRLPHCVYVPIGVGFSVCTVPLLNRSWRNRLLEDAGEILYPAKAELAKVGIELDERLWTVGQRNER